VDRVHGVVDRGQRRSMVDHGQRAQRCLTGVRHAGARARQCSPAMEGEDEPFEALLGRCPPATEGWRRGGALEATEGEGGRERAQERRDEVR
jgi:hypothetical protein